ncbi:MAG: hypothetical protein Q8R28_06065 [Dehalococcoidia bacterium]|nr:hypothetical protein [Dehalococcoidia bacterium]
MSLFPDYSMLWNIPIVLAQINISIVRNAPSSLPISCSFSPSGFPRAIYAKPRFIVGSSSRLATPGAWLIKSLSSLYGMTLIANLLAGPQSNEYPMAYWATMLKLTLAKWHESIVSYKLQQVKYVTLHYWPVDHGLVGLALVVAGALAAGGKRGKHGDPPDREEDKP